MKPYLKWKWFSLLVFILYLDVYTVYASAGPRRKKKKRRTARSSPWAPTSSWVPKPRASNNDDKHEGPSCLTKAEYTSEEDIKKKQLMDELAIKLNTTIFPEYNITITGPNDGGKFLCSAGFDFVSMFNFTPLFPYGECFSTGDEEFDKNFPVGNCIIVSGSSLELYECVKCVTDAPTFLEIIPTISPSIAPTNEPTTSPTFIEYYSINNENLMVRFNKDTKYFNINVNSNAGEDNFETTIPENDDISIDKDEFRKLNQMKIKGRELQNQEAGSLPFELEFRCYWAFLLKQKLKDKYAFTDFILNTDFDDLVVDLIPSVKINQKLCIDEEDGSKICPVKFSILNAGKGEFIRPTFAPSKMPTSTPTFEISSSPSSSPSAAPNDGTGTDDELPNTPGETDDYSNIVAGPPDISVTPTSSSPTYTPSTSNPTATPSVDNPTISTPEPSKTAKRKEQYDLDDFLKNVVVGTDPDIVNNIFEYYTGSWKIDNSTKVMSQESTLDNDVFRILVNQQNNESSFENQYFTCDLNVTSYTYRQTLPNEAVEMLDQYKISSCPIYSIDEPVKEKDQQSEMNGVDILSISLGSVIFIVLTILSVIFYRRYKVTNRHPSKSLYNISSGSFRMKKQSNPAEEKEKLYSELGIDIDQLVTGLVIGHGANGRIFKGQYCKSDVAVKEVFPFVLEQSNNNNLSLSNRSINDPKDQIWREVRNLRLLRHPNVIQLYGCAQTRSEETGQLRFLIVMELACCSLRDLLQSEDIEDTDENLDIGVQQPPFVLKEFDLSKKLCLIKEVCAGLGYIHDCDMIHFDIKPENILLNQAGQAKICDLGIAKLQSGPNQTINMTLSTLGGTPPYMAPELLRGDMGEVGNSVDIYALAIMLWQIFHPNDTPHPKTWTMAKLFHEVMVEHYRPVLMKEKYEIPDFIEEIIQGCWHSQPNRRPTCRDIIQNISNSTSTIKSQFLQERGRLTSSEDIDFLPNPGSTALFWEHTQRRYIQCTIESKYIDQSDMKFNIKLLKDDIIYRQEEPNLKIEFPEVEQEFLSVDDSSNFDSFNTGTSTSTCSQSIAVRQEQSFESISPPTPNDKQSMTFVNFVELKEAGDEESQKRCDVMNEDQQKQHRLRNVSDESGDSIDSEICHSQSIKQKKKELMLYRNGVSEAFLRTEASDPSTLPRKCAYKSLQLLANLHFLDVLKKNGSNFLTMQTTIANLNLNRNEIFSGNQLEGLSLYFESDLEDDDCSTPAISPINEGTEASKNNESLARISVGSNSSIAIELKRLFTLRSQSNFGEEEERKFEDRKMSICRFAELDFEKLNLNRCSVGIHLPTFSLLTVQQLRSFHNEDMLSTKKIIESLNKNWSKIYGITNSKSKNIMNSTDRIKKRSFAQCPELLGFYGCFVDTNEQAATILFEYMDGGSLQNVIDCNYICPGYDDIGESNIYNDQNDPEVDSAIDKSCTSNNDGNLMPEKIDFTISKNAICHEPTLATIAQSLLKALVFLHKHDEIHFGVRPGNVLINTKGLIKLGGYGMNIIDVSHYDSNEKNNKNKAFFSPEQVLGVGNLTPASDVWSACITLLSAAIGHSVFQEEQSQDSNSFYKLIQNNCPISLPSSADFPAPPKYPQLYNTSYKFSNHMRDFFTKGLAFNPNKRSSAEELLNHPWIINNITPFNVNTLQGSFADQEEKVIADISNAIIQRVVGSMESRQYFCKHPQATNDKMVITIENLDRLAEQLCVSPSLVKESFIYNADLAGIKLSLNSNKFSEGDNDEFSLSSDSNASVAEPFSFQIDIENSFNKI